MIFRKLNNYYFYFKIHQKAIIRYILIFGTFTESKNLNESHLMSKCIC
jgi:hypothetical protein